MSSFGNDRSPDRLQRAIHPRCRQPRLARGIERRKHAVKAIGVRLRFLAHR
jgi:hypothetical protein